jgi:two-component system, LytTR family, sensor kinase
MMSPDFTTLVHVLGFLAGIALYAMLGVMTLRAPGSGESVLGSRGDRIPLVTAVLGIVWNSGALVFYGGRDFGLSPPSPWLAAVAFSALGFLPAVVVHASLASRESSRVRRLLVLAGYALSASAMVLHTVSAVRHEVVPSRAALLTLTLGYASIMALLAVFTQREPRARRTLSVVALAVFAVMALHLSQHVAGTAGPESLPLVLLGHHASIPLALVILYQDYRFALADIFLKRGITLVALVALAVLLYTEVAAPMLASQLRGGATQPGVVGVLLALWILTALAYPVLRKGVARFVDRVVLRRSDYRESATEVGVAIDALTSAEEILDTVCARLAVILSATYSVWTVADDGPRATTRLARISAMDGGQEAVVRIPTMDGPRYRVVVGQLTGGRRLMSDDLMLLETIANLTARRINAVRVTDERYARDVREREILQLATEAELRALRAQLNPHFLFNTLTTIGQLIREAPDRALETLYRLTGLLRAVLRGSEGEFVTLGEELKIVRSYLAIERARFEERLAVTIDVPQKLWRLPVPPLLLQPLVENAVRHGIGPRKLGGRVTIAANLGTAEELGAEVRRNGAGRVLDTQAFDRRASERLNGEGPWLRLSVADTGVGVTREDLARHRQSGIGLSNIERRLDRYFGAAARLEIHSDAGAGTTVEILIPLRLVQEAAARSRTGAA